MSMKHTSSTLLAFRAMGKLRSTLPGKLGEFRVAKESLSLIVGWPHIPVE
jgi:hypothetical protein